DQEKPRNAHFFPEDAEEQRTQRNDVRALRRIDDEPAPTLAPPLTSLRTLLLWDLCARIASRGLATRRRSASPAGFLSKQPQRDTEECEGDTSRHHVLPPGRFGQRLEHDRQEVLDLEAGAAAGEDLQAL